MDFAGLFFPGISDPELGQSNRSYSYDPMGSQSQQQSHYAELIEPTAENLTWLTPFGHYAGVPQRYPGEDFGNVELMKPAFFSSPSWWGAAGVGGINNDWNDLRQEGVGYGLYAPHLPMQPMPVWKLYEPGSGFILPATFLGQPLVPRVQPPGT